MIARAVALQALLIFMVPIALRAAPIEDCVSYDPNSLRFEHAAAAWILTDGEHQIAAFDNERDVTNALAVARHHLARCTVGSRPDRLPGVAIVDYWKGTSTMIVFVEPETCTSYDPSSLKTTSAPEGGRIVTDGRRFTLRLTDRKDAERILAVARRYRAHCAIAHLHYWRDGYDLPAPDKTVESAKEDKGAGLMRIDDELLVAVVKRTLRDNDWAAMYLRSAEDSRPRCVEYTTDAADMSPTFPVSVWLLQHLRRYQRDLVSCAADDENPYDRLTLGPVAWTKPGKEAYVRYGPFGGIIGRAGFAAHRGLLGWQLTPMIRE